MKRMMIWVLLLLLILPSAMASSLFSLPTVTRDKAEAAPSYGVMADVTPDSTKTLKDGTKVQVYQDVSDNDYLDFGILLADLGYGVARQSASGSVVSAVVEKGNISFQVDYDQKKDQLTVSYPAGVAIEEKDFFEDYIEVEYGESFKFSGVAQVTVKNMKKLVLMGTANSALEVEIKNLSNKQLTPGETLSVTLHIINEDNHYTYETYHYGAYRAGSVTNYLAKITLKPLEKNTEYYAFRVLYDDLMDIDGLKAVTIELDDEKYVYYFQGK